MIFLEDKYNMINFKQFLKESTFNREKAISDLENFLEGELRPHAASFVDAGIHYNIDPYLTASIAMLETGRGKASVLTKFKNVGGVWDSKTKHHRQYSNLRDSIFDQARILKNGYISQGLNTIPEIGKKYAPPGAANDPNGTNAQWPRNVASFYRQVTGSGELLAGGSLTGAATVAAIGSSNTTSSSDVSSDDTAQGDTDVAYNQTTNDNEVEDNSEDEDIADDENSGVASAMKKVYSGISDIISATN